MGSCSSSAARSAVDSGFSATPSRSSARPASSRTTPPCSAPLRRAWPAAGRSRRDSRPSTRRSQDPSATRSTGASRSSCASRASWSRWREARGPARRPRGSSSRRSTGRAGKGGCPWSCGGRPAPPGGGPGGGTGGVRPGRRASSWPRSMASSPRASTPPISAPRRRSSTSSGRPAVVQYGGSATVSRRSPLSDDLMTKGEDLIENMINPAVAGHGGFVQLVDVKDNKVYLQMGGGCQGCGAADVTLKQGIERLIKEELPEIEEVLDATDHAAGTNPYYTPEK